MNMYLYNNVGIGVVSIASVLESLPILSVSKAALIIPMITHSELLGYLSRQGTNVSSLERLITDKTSCFANFDKRYYDSLCLTINSIQFMNDMGYINFSNGKIELINSVSYSKKMGKRAEKIYKASGNISKLLCDSPEKLYLNLRISL